MGAVGTECVKGLVQGGNNLACREQEVVGENPKLTNQSPLLVYWILVLIRILTTAFETVEKRIQESNPFKITLTWKTQAYPASFLRQGLKDAGERESQEKAGLFFLE